MLATESRAALKAKIKDLRDKHSVYGEMKWGTVSENKHFLKSIDSVTLPGGI